VPVVKRLFQRSVHFSLGGLLLLVSGFFSLDERFVPSKRGNKIPSNPLPGNKIESGHVILSNHVSYVSLIYLLYKFSPQFSITPNQWTDLPEGKVIPVTFYKMLQSTIYQNKTTGDQATSVKLLIKQCEKEKRGPIVIFPEATTTNGKVLLGCVPVLVQPIDKLHIIGFKFDYHNFSPVYPAGSFLVHSFRLCSEFYNTMQVRYVLESDIGSVDIDNSWKEQVLDLLAGSIAVRRAKLLAIEKHEFLEYFYSYAKSYKS